MISSRECRKSNCQLLCANRNRRKGKKTQAQFLAELERYKSQLVLQPGMAGAGVSCSVCYN